MHDEGAAKQDCRLVDLVVLVTVDDRDVLSAQMMVMSQFITVVEIWVPWCPAPPALGPLVEARRHAHARNRHEGGSY